MALLLGLIMATGVVLVARWAWEYQSRVLEVIRPAELLRRLEVRITGVLVNDRSVILGVRDEMDGSKLHTLVVAIGHERDGVVATLERWCRDGARLQLERVASSGRVVLHHLHDNRTLALKLAAG